MVMRRTAQRPLLLLSLLGALLSGVGLAAEPKVEASTVAEAACHHASTETLSQRTRLNLEELFNVVELEEGPTHARLRIVAQVGPTQVLRQLEAALGEAWARQPTPAAQGGNAQSSSAGPLTAIIYRAHYLDESTSQSLRVTVQPVGRSNLFRLELRLSPTGATQAP